MSSRHNYDDAFFNWVDYGAERSAQVLLPCVQSIVRPASVLDVGCGRGTWLRVWQTLGVGDVIGIDGDYVDRDKLAISTDRFRAVDLCGRWGLSRRFDLVQSLEVAEHLPAASAEAFVTNSCASGDLILFSAAQPGQGGEMHVNERPPTYWARLFAQHGYRMFDPIRPRVKYNVTVEPWYRYNTFIYANQAGIARLPQEMLDTEILPGHAPEDLSDFGWRMRKLILRPLPVAVVTAASRAHYRLRTALRNIRFRS